MARSIQTSLLQPFRFDGHEIVVTSSIGIALYPEDGTDPGKVMQRSNTAMARAKELGGNAIVFYESDMNVRAERRLLLETELRRAVREHQLVLHYQPIVDLRTMRVVGAEALMRWVHPERGMISPADFIPIAEETGLIIDMGCWLVDEVGAQIERWNDTRDGAAALFDQRQRAPAAASERHPGVDRTRPIRARESDVGRNHRKRADGRPRGGAVVPEGTARARRSRRARRFRHGVFVAQLSAQVPLRRAESRPFVHPRPRTQQYRSGARRVDRVDGPHSRRRRRRRRRRDRTRSCSVSNRSAAT